MEVVSSDKAEQSELMAMFARAETVIISIGPDEQLPPSANDQVARCGQRLLVISSSWSVSSWTPRSPPAPPGAW
jgi:hypothetical protein